MSIKYNSCITKSLIKISSKFSLYNFSQSAAAHNYFLNLSKSQKNQYVKNYEKFWYSFFIISDILGGLSYATKKLEEIKKRKKICNDSGKSNNESQKITFYYKNFYNSICVLLKFIIDNKITGRYPFIQTLLFSSSTFETAS